MHPADFRRARQEAQNVALIALERGSQHLGRLQLERQLGAPRHIVGCDSMSTPLRRDEGRVSQQRRERIQIQGRRHHQKPQILPQRFLAFEAERKPEIRIEAALVKFVEYDAADPLQRRIALEHARQDPFRDHLDAGVPAHACLDARAETHGPANGIAEQLSHATRHRARGDAARLQHQDLAAPEPRGVQQGQRNEGALAGTRRGMQQHPRVRGQRLRQGPERGTDRQRR